MKKIICVLLGILILLVYWKIQYHEFVNYDDGRYITKNKHIKDFSKENFIWAFTKSHSANWHPITWLSHMLDFRLYGLNPKGHHLTSLVLHIANSLLLFLVFARMTGAIWQSCFIASLFAFHPINIESVAWAAERKNLLSTFFWFLTMWAHIHYVQKRNLARYSMVFLFFSLGLMSKAMLVTLPFVLLLLDYWPLKRFEITHQKIFSSDEKKSHIENKNKILNSIFEKIPLLFLVIGSCIVTLSAQKLAGAIVSIESISSTTRISNALVSYLGYLEKMIWPKNLSVFYPYPIEELYVWKGLVSGFVLTGITIIVLRLIKKAPYLSVGWFWYLGTLIPVIGLVQVGQQAMADRYAYVPLIGIFIIIAWGLPESLKNFHFKKTILFFLAGIFFSVLIRLSWVQLHHWENSEKLFNHAIEVTDKKYPSFVGIYNNLGVVLNDQLKFKEAMIHLKSAVKLQPAYSEAHNNLGNALSGLNRFREADIYYKEAIRLNPNYPEAHNNLANSLSKKLSFDEAIIHYKKAIQLKPEYHEAHFNLGVTLNKWNQSEQAIGPLEEAIRLNPNFTEALLSLGNILSQKYKFKTAIHHFKTIIKMDPSHAIANNSLGSALAGQGNFSQAIVHFHTSITSDPHYLEAHQNLGKIFLILGQPEQSAIYFEIAKQLAINKKLKQ
jgi:protein O-mannosyl-transferase